MKGYALPRVFVLSITGEGCQESGEIKVNNSDKCVCICTLPLIAARRSSPRFTLCNNNTNISANNRIVIILTEQPVATAEASLLNVTQVYHRKKKKKKKERNASDICDDEVQTEGNYVSRLFCVFFLSAE